MSHFTTSRLLWSRVLGTELLSLMWGSFASRRGTFSEARIGARIGVETSKRGDPIFTPPVWNIVGNGFEWLLLTSPVLETKQTLTWSIPRGMKRKQQASTLFLHVKWTWSLPADGGVPTGGVEMKVRPCYLTQDLHMPGPQVYRRRRHSLRAEFASSKFEHYIVLHVPWWARFRTITPLVLISRNTYQLHSIFFI